MKFGFNEYPPWSVIKGAQYGGIDIDILREIVKQLHWQIDVVTCPWKRCLSLMAEGKIDVLSNMAKLTEREAYLYYVEPPASTSDEVVFYLRKGSTIKLTKYSDLYALKVGTVIGSATFDPFDSDTRLNKHKVGSFLQLYQMLQSGRIDVFCGPEITSDYDLFQKGYSKFFKKAPYRERSSYGYFAFSKKSVLASERFKFAEVLKQLIDSGKVSEIESRYLQ